MAHIKTAVISLITAMILSLVLTYASLLTIVQKTESDLERGLRSYVVQYSADIYSNIKNGTDYTPSITPLYLITGFINDGTFYCDGNFIYNVNSRGGYVYKVSIPQTQFTIANTLNVTGFCDLYIPIEFAGKKITDLKIPIGVKVSYNLINGKE